MQAAPASNTEIDVTWTDNSNNEDELSIEREEVAEGTALAANGGSARTYEQVGTVGANGKANK